MLQANAVIEYGFLNYCDATVVETILLNECAVIIFFLSKLLNCD